MDETDFPGARDTFPLLGEVLRRAVLETSAFHGLAPPAASASAEEILTALRGFPLLTKADLRRTPRAFLSRAHADRPLREAWTGGSTGVPLTLLRDADELAVERDMVRRAWAPLGLSPEDRVAVLRARHDSRSGRGIVFTDRQETSWIEVTSLEVEALDPVLEVLAELRPALIRGYGSIVDAVASYAARRGYAFGGLKGMAWSSDEMPPAEQRMIREGYGIPLLSLYGQTERVAMAVSAPFSSRHQVFADYGFVELVRADGTLVTEPGERGEIVGTSLFPRATTLIRYRTGDLAAWAAPGVLDRLDGRAGTILTTRDGARIPPSWDDKDAVLHAVPRDVRVQFHQPAPGSLVLRVDSARRPDMAAMIAAFERFGDRFDLAFDWEARLTLTPMGKRQLFIVGG